MTAFNIPVIFGNFWSKILNLTSLSSMKIVMTKSIYRHNFFAVSIFSSTTLYKVCAVHWGLCSAIGGYHQSIGGYHDLCGDIIVYPLRFKAVVAFP